MDSPELNPPQRQAVEHGAGPLLILAGAGSGKTRVITRRLARLVKQGAAPWRILAVTFTNKAAGEMRTRAAELLGEERARRLWIGTFHSTAARLLRIHAARAGLRSDYQIYDDDDQKKLIARVMTDLMINDRVISTRAMLSRIDQQKNEGLSVDEYAPDDYLGELVARVWPEYQRRLRAANAVDFGDLLVELRRLTDDDVAGPDLRGRYDHVLVDEFQDTNRVQYRIVQRLAARRNLCVVGDDDQAIYRWRGADVRNILDFERDYPDCLTVKLEQNYRSTEVILAAANGVIARNRGRREKHLFTEIRGGEPLVYFTADDERREAQFIVSAIHRLHLSEGHELSEFAILYRMHAQSRALEEALRAQAMPYKIYGGVRFFDRAEVKDLLAYLRVLINPGDEVSLDRVVNVPPRGIGDATLDKLAQHAHRGGITLWEAMRQAVGERPARRSGPPGEPLFGVAPEEAPPGDVLGTGPRRKLEGFVKLVEKLQERAAHEPSLAELAAFTLDESGLLERLQKEGTAEARERIGNLEELLNSIRDYERDAETPTLVEYLERVALLSAADASGGGVALMTVHAAKGLEFPVVFLAGLEEGTFPLLGEDTSIEELEDERRLCYVAVTRARKRLVLTNAAHRRLWGRGGERRLGFTTEPLDDSDPLSLRESRFIGDIPAACIARPVARPSRPRGGALPGSRRDDGSYIERDGDEPPEEAGPPRLALTASQAGGRYVDYDEGPDAAGGFRVGQRVRHERFGEGRVQKLIGSGNGLLLLIDFPGIGEVKKVVARFVQPE